MVISEFISKALDKWAYENNVTLAFSRPSKLTNYAFIEFFNSSFYDKYLNIHRFLLLDNVKSKAENRRYDYNYFRPYSSLNIFTPKPCTPF